MPVSRKRKTKSGKPIKSHRRRPTSSMLAMCSSAERYFNQILAHAQRTLRTGDIDLETKEVLLMLERVGMKVAEFQLWLSEADETQWMRELDNIDDLDDYIERENPPSDSDEAITLEAMK